MYHSHFGFNTLPFNINPDSQFTFLSTGFLRTRETVLRGLRGKSRCVVLSGMPGSGKTTLLNHLCQHPPVGYEYIRVPYANLNFSELLEQIYQRLVPTAAGESTSAAQTDALLATLIRQRRYDQQFVVVIDEAQNLTDSTLGALLELAADADPGEPLLRLLLVGHPELVTNMRAAETAAGGSEPDKIRYCELQPLAAELTDDYIRYRLTAAGGEHIDLFDDQAVALIWQYSKGVPRIINMLCGYALLVAFEESHPVVDRDIILESVASLDCGEPTDPQLTTPPAATATASSPAHDASAVESASSDTDVADNAASSTAAPLTSAAPQQRTRVRSRPSFRNPPTRRPSSPSRAVKRSARGRYQLLATAVAMSVLIGGLLAWRIADFSASTAATPALTATAPARETPSGRAPDNAPLALPPPPADIVAAVVAGDSAAIKPPPTADRTGAETRANDYIQTMLRKEQNPPPAASEPGLARAAADTVSDAANHRTAEMPQTVEDWKIELSSLSSTADSAGPTPAALNSDTASAGPGELVAATIIELGHFVTASGVQDRAPFGVSDTFSPGRIYAFARVHAPKDEVLTLSWYHAGGRLISQLQLEVRRNVSGGYRTYGWKTLYQTGDYEVRLYNQEQALIAQRRFSVR